MERREKNSPQHSALSTQRTRCSGQGTTEFVLMLGLLTALGIYFMNTFVGHDGHSGTVHQIQVVTPPGSAPDPHSVIDKIAKDQ